MSLMVLSSMSYTRRRFYESFLLVHIGLAIITTCAVFRHVSIQRNQYNGYLWAAIATWSFDRAARLLRIIYCNWRARRLSETPSTVTYDSKSNLLRITVRPGTMVARPKPGQHYFLYQPFSLRGWESHPFTLAAYNSAQDTTTTTSLDIEKKGAETSASTVLSDDSSASLTDFTFYARPYQGWTGRLKSQCLKSGTKICTTPILLEGPYGATPDMRAADSVLLIVGGTGISAATAYIRDHLRRRQNRSGSTTMTQQIHLVWSARQVELFEHVLARELAPALAREDVKLDLYCTSRDASVSSDSDSEAPRHKPKDLGLGAASRITFGRCQPRDLIASSARDADEASCSLAVFTCGPAMLADECRDAVYREMAQGSRNITYHEDALCW